MAPTRRQRLARLRRGDDEGSVFVIVLVFSFILAITLSTAISAVTANLGSTVTYQSTSRAELASQSGVDAELTAMRIVSVYTSLPCGMNGTVGLTGSISSYTVAVAYSAGGTPLTCAGATLGGATPPTTAVLTSTGTAKHGTKVITSATVSISASGSVLSQALGYAIFTNGSMSLPNAVSLDVDGTNAPPNVYVGQTLSCTNGTLSQGSVTTYTAVSLSGACAFVGSLVAEGAVTMANSTSVGGSVTSYGGGISMSGTALIGGNATATGGNIGLIGSAKILGNALATGTITTAGGSKVSGTETPNDGILSGQTAPTTVAFPNLNPAVTDWQNSGWQVVQIPNATYTSCMSYFQNNSSGAPDAFMNQISTLAVKTVIYAPTCPVSYSRSHVFQLSADVVLQVQTLTLAGTNTFESTTFASPTPTVHNFSILAATSLTCSTSSPEVSFANNTDFDTSLSTFIYTPGQVIYANDANMNGEILACDGFTSANAFTLSFDPTAATSLPWTGSAPSPPTIVVTNKDLLRG